MTDIAFHTGIANPLDYACRLLRKAYRSGARVAVHADAPLLERLDQALWTFEPLEFIPHIVLPRDGGDAMRLAQTLLVLVRPGASAPPECRIAVTLAGAEVDDVGRFERLIAIVGIDPAQREAGRLRWREYERAGHPISHVAKPAGLETPVRAAPTSHSATRDLLGRASARPPGANRLSPSGAGSGASRVVISRALGRPERTA